MQNDNLSLYVYFTPMEKTMSLTNMQRSPGVYLTETDLSQSIIGPSTTVGAVVGASPKGPVSKPALITSTTEFTNTFGIPVPSVSFMHYGALSYLLDGGTIYAMRVLGAGALWAGCYLTVDSASATPPILSLSSFSTTAGSVTTPVGIFDPINTMGFLVSSPNNATTLLYFAAIDPGAWNNRITIQVTPSNPLGAAIGIGHDVTTFYVKVYIDYADTSSQPAEIFLCSREQSVDGFGNQLFVESVINTKSKIINVKNNPFCGVVNIETNALLTLVGGADGALPTSGQIATAWSVLADPETYPINVLINAGYSTPDVQHAMDATAKALGNCVALLDVPSNLQQTADATTYRNVALNLDSNYSALYTPDVLVYDPYNDMQLYIPLSGYAAAICARTDQQAALWKAPAGLTRGILNVLGVRQIYNQQARDALDAANINMLRKFSNGMGYVLWGQNTLQSEASALSNLNVRRLISYVEKAISGSSLYSDFELNSSLLRLFISNLATSFLQPIKNAGGLYDFKVVCDDTNNTNDTVASGDLMLDCYFDPVIPAKRIHLNAIITKTGSAFTTTIS